MTFDTSPLERDCVLLNCSQPAIAPLKGQVYCARHDPNPPAPQPPPAPADVPETVLPDRPDPATLEPHWDGNQWVLKPRAAGTVQVNRAELEELFESVNRLAALVGGWLRAM